MKSAAQSQRKWAEKAGSAGQDYVEGASATNKDQAANAAAAEGRWKEELDKAFARKAFSVNVLKAGKNGWLEGVREKGASNYGVGVTSQRAATKYAQNSAEFDGARGAAASLPRGAKGSATNLNRVTAVVQALRKQKTGQA